MVWSRDFKRLEEKLEELAEKFDDKGDGRQPRDPETGRFQSKEGRFNPKNRIGDGISKALQQGVVPEAKHSASRHVTATAKQSIRSESLSWNRHQFGATHDLVKYHEYGTSTKATDPSRATINAPNGDGYVIPIDGYDSLPFGPDQVALMDELDFHFIVHPGVRGKHFMRDALMGNTWLIEEKVAEELDKIGIDL